MLLFFFQRAFPIDRSLNSIKKCIIPLGISRKRAVIDGVQPNALVQPSCRNNPASFPSDPFRSKVYDNELVFGCPSAELSPLYHGTKEPKNVCWGQETMAAFNRQDGNNSPRTKKCLFSAQF